MNTRKYEAKGGKQKEEHALYAGAQFKGKCNHCGKYGHRVRDCWEKDPSKKLKRNDKAQANISSNNRQTNSNSNSNSNNNSLYSSSFKEKCRYCQIVGHKEAE